MIRQPCIQNTVDHFAQGRLDGQDALIQLSSYILHSTECVSLFVLHDSSPYVAVASSQLYIFRQAINPLYGTGLYLSPYQT